MPKDFKQYSSKDLFKLGMQIVGDDEINGPKSDQKYSDDVRVEYVNNLKYRMRDTLAHLTDCHDELKELYPDYTFVPLGEYDTTDYEYIAYTHPTNGKIYGVHRDYVLEDGTVPQELLDSIEEDSRQIKRREAARKRDTLSE